jgi:hypothetical protein
VRPPGDEDGDDGEVGLGRLEQPRPVTIRHPVPAAPLQAPHGAGRGAWRRPG